jgi:hypothetical protein
MIFPCRKQSQNNFKTFLKHPQKIKITTTATGIQKVLDLSMNEEHIISLSILIKN